ncbi:prolyl oligopeptidase family-domain-containing protein [Syncephalis plumigaleata]|nr:prolyl oligopeptidase family-domain-containing protein [Syncephalis plumigaleata]
MKYSIILAIVALASSCAVLTDAAIIQRRGRIPEGGYCTSITWKDCEEGTRCEIKANHSGAGMGGAVVMGDSLASPNPKPGFCQRSSGHHLSPPIAPAVRYARTYHQRPHLDPYDWMQNSRGVSVEMQKHLQEENNYANTMLAPLCQLQQMIASEIRQRTSGEDPSLVQFVGDYKYYTRYPLGKEFTALYRSYQRQPNQPEQLLFDGNAFGSNYVKILYVQVSPDERHIGIAANIKGTDAYNIYVVNLATNMLLSHITINDAAPQFQWHSDSKSIIYAHYYDGINHVKRRFLTKSGIKEDVLHREKNEEREIKIKRSSSDEYIFIESEDYYSSDVYYMDREMTNLQRFVLSEENHAYSVDHFNGQFLIISNMDQKGMLSEVQQYYVCDDIDECDYGFWRKVFNNVVHTNVKYITAASQYMAVFEQVNGINAIKLFKLDGEGKLNSNALPYRVINIPFTAYNVAPMSHQPSRTSNILRIAVESLIVPISQYDCDMAIGQCRLIFQQDVANYNQALYTTTRIHATSRSRPNSGQPNVVQVPITIAYRNDKLNWDGSNFAWLHGYGAYGETSTPKFDPNIISLLDRGFVYAIAHVRGGGDLGDAWTDGGRLHNKQNSFNDFIAAALQLVQAKLTRHELLVIEGHSAGGMLVGAVMNQMPNIAKVAVTYSPFVDVLNTMMNPNLPLTKGEYPEWGNPTNKDDFNVIKSYSPYDNIKVNVKYPNMLVRVGIKDQRVPYWDPSKWVARLRASSVAGGPQDPEPHVILQLTDTESGHFGSAKKNKIIEDKATDIAFAIDKLEKSLQVLKHQSDLRPVYYLLP